MEASLSDRFSDCLLLSPEGDCMWRGEHQRRAFIGNTVKQNTAMFELLGCKQPEHSCRKEDVLRSAKALGLINSEGCMKGFLNVLPKGVLLHQCVEAFNREHLSAFNPARIDFPLVFDSQGAEISALVDGYERQHRLFRLADTHGKLRLSYAADPGLFGMLKDKRLIESRLPYAVYSPTPVFRRLQSGEISLDHQRQYHVPDLHILCSEESALGVYAQGTALAAGGARFWLGSDFVQFLDIAEDVIQQHPEFAATMAKAAGQFTLVNVMKKRPRYYGVRTGMMAYAGFGNVMLYNLQWDDTNSGLFNIKTQAGKSVIVVHATVAGGWPKIMPITLGRSLSGLGPKSLPVEVAPVQIVCIPIDPVHQEKALTAAERLASHGLRVRIDLDYGKSLGRRVRTIREAWEPYVVVIGDKELQPDAWLIKEVAGTDIFSLETFLVKYGQRLERCCPHSPIGRIDLPFELTHRS